MGEHATGTMARPATTTAWISLRPPNSKTGIVIVEPGPPTAYGATARRGAEHDGGVERSMKQLTGLDSSFLRMETPSTYGHVASLAIFDPATSPHSTDFEAVRALIESRLHLVPPFRRR